MSEQIKKYAYERVQNRSKAYKQPRYAYERTQNKPFRGTMKVSSEQSRGRQFGPGIGSKGVL